LLAEHVDLTLPQEYVVAARRNAIARDFFIGPGRLPALA
jgi:hypothetical protein